MPDHAQRRSCPTAWSGGCRRRSTSNRSRSPQHAVAEQLGEQLEVRGLAAAGAHARELEQRLGTCEPLTVRGAEGAVEGCDGTKKSQRPLDGAVLAIGSMLMALCRPPTSTWPGTRRRRRRSPCSRRARPGSSDAGREGRATGNPSSDARRRQRHRAGSYTFMRIAAWGHTIRAPAQSMQMSGSQIGISAASCASRSGRSGGTCRRPGALAPGAGRLRRRASAP